ncbi:TPA: tyrosine-type recombinase/integrase [Pseudomonas aeruginosa]|nr:site-specific integrase [Stutzerimonas nitrititolerans]
MPGPTPLFDTYSRFLDLNALDLTGENQAVKQFLARCSHDLRPVEGYMAVRAFLKSYAGNEATFNSYRTHVERLLLWSLLVQQIPLLTLRRKDAESFMEFCLAPPKSWVGPIVKSRFVRVGGRKIQASDPYVVNESWRPFNVTAPKRERSVEQPPIGGHGTAYTMSQGSVAQVFAVCGSFYQYAIDESLTEVNPFRAIKQKSVYKQRNRSDSAARSLTQLQWSYVLETAEIMAAEDARHERTLFIIATMFSMYLRVSDLVGRANWTPTMGDIRRDTAGNWWFYVVGKGNKAAKVSIRDDYIQTYLTRYRRVLGLSDLPGAHEKTPLISTLNGRGGLSDRHVRLLIQMVFDRSLQRMIGEGWTPDEVAELRSASLHWLRHTSATFDAPLRDMKDLQADLRHSSLATTQSTYYNSLDEQRAHSVKRLKVIR